MSNTRTLLIADAIVGIINDAARSWSGSVTATRKYRPRWSKSELGAQVVCAVAPATRVREPLAKMGGPVARIVTIDLGFFKAITGNETERDTELDTLVSLVETIEDFFFQYDFTVNGIDCMVRRSGAEPLYDREQLDEDQVFGSVISLEVYEAA